MVQVPWEAAGLAPGEVELIFHLEITLPTMTAFLDAGKSGAVVH